MFNVHMMVATIAIFMSCGVIMLAAHCYQLHDTVMHYGQQLSDQKRWIDQLLRTGPALKRTPWANVLENVNALNPANDNTVIEMPDASVDATVKDLEEKPPNTAALAVSEKPAVPA